MALDAAYFARRAFEERLAADRAQHARARQAHLDVAVHYRALARAVAAYQRQHRASRG